MKKKNFFLIGICILIAPSYGIAQRQYDLVKDFGARADNKTNCYAAFQKAAADISAAKGGTLNIPKGTYYIDNYKTGGGSKANNITDIIFSNCNNLTIKGNGSTIRLNGKFIRSNDYGIPGEQYRYAYNNTVSPFSIRGCSNVIVQDIILDGGVRSMKKEAVAEGECNGIVIDDAGDNNLVSNNVTLRNISSNYFATDGFYIRCKGTNINIINCSGKCNGRQGLSLVGGKKIVVQNCKFDSTGFTGNYGWHAPGAGIDVESELGNGKLKDVKIKNCSLRYNKGFQIVTTLQSEDVQIDSCFICDLTNGYGDGLNGVGMYSLNSSLSNSIIFGTLQIDLAGQIYTGPMIQQFTKNILYSGWRGIVSSDFARPCNIADNIIVVLPKSATGEYFPYIQNYNCTFNNNIIMGSPEKVATLAAPVNGLVQIVKEASNNIWLLNDFPVADKTLAGSYYIIAFNNTVKLGNQYFAPNGKIASYNYSFFKFITPEAATKFASFDVFKAFNQKDLDKKYLGQAKDIRNYAQKAIK